MRPKIVSTVNAHLEDGAVIHATMAATSACLHIGDDLHIFIATVAQINDMRAGLDQAEKLLSEQRSDAI